jgi:hypothetical protein
MYILYHLSQLPFLCHLASGPAPLLPSGRGYIAPSFVKLGCIGVAIYSISCTAYSGSGSWSAPPLAVDDETLASLAAVAEGSSHCTLHQYLVSCTVIIAVFSLAQVAVVLVLVPLQDKCKACHSVLSTLKLPPATPHYLPKCVMVYVLGFDRSPSLLQVVRRLISASSLVVSQ